MSFEAVSKDYDLEDDGVVLPPDVQRGLLAYEARAAFKGARDALEHWLDWESQDDLLKVASKVCCGLQRIYQITSSEKNPTSDECESWARQKVSETIRQHAPRSIAFGCFGAGE